METSSILPTVDFFLHRLLPTTTSAEHAVSSAKDTAYASTWDRRYYSTNTGDRSHFTTAIPVFQLQATLLSSGPAVFSYSLSFSVNPATIK